MTDTDLRVESGSETLAAHLARPPGLARVPGLVLCHGFPHGSGGAATVGATYPPLADRLSRDTGWAVVTFNFRGTGASSGDFSVSGWLEDVATMAGFLSDRTDIDSVWLAGSATGGAICVCHAASDERIQGVATMAAPASIRNWVENAPRFLDYARRLGVVRSPSFPPDTSVWAREIAELDPVAAAAKIAPRPFMVLHGADDDVVPRSASVALAEAYGPEVEHRILSGAGHRLRHDPRVVALLAGWMSRQR